jgi:hypothetical protein
MESPIFPQLRSTVYKSTDHGDTFSVVTSGIGGFLYTGDTNDFIDKGLIAVDPNNGKVYVAFTYFNNVSPFYAIYVWNVTDGFSTIVTSNGTGLQGPIPAVDSDHALYVAYESWDADGQPYIKIKKTTDFGTSFGSEVNVYGPFSETAHLEATTFCGRNALKGNIRSNDFPSLAVDTRISGAGAGNLYIALNAATAGPGCPSWGCVDIYITRSTDGGATWSAQS